jgi:hypothetical protein
VLRRSAQALNWPSAVKKEKGAIFMRPLKHFWKPLQNSLFAVIPAKAGILERYKSTAYVALDSRFRGNDEFCRGFHFCLKKRMNNALSGLKLSF